MFCLATPLGVLCGLVGWEFFKSRTLKNPKQEMFLFVRVTPKDASTSRNASTSNKTSEGTSSSTEGTNAN